MGGDVAGAGGVAYVSSNTMSAPFAATLQKITSGSSASTLGTYAGEETTTVAADGSGIFMFATGMGSGIYAVDPSSGAQTPFDSANGDLNTSVFALDSQNLYFVEVAGGKYSIWSKAR